MRTKQNTAIIRLEDGREVFQSYGVTVAAFIPRGRVWLREDGTVYDGPCGHLRTSERYSVTTSRHANGYAGKASPEVSHDTLIALTAPVSSRL